MELARFSDIATKEVINVRTGKCIGYFADCDMIIDPATGRILEVVLAGRGGLAGLLGPRPQTFVIPWDGIVRIGIDTIIVDIEEQNR